MKIMGHVLLAASTFIAMGAIILSTIAGAAQLQAPAASAPTIQVYANPG